MRKIFAIRDKDGSFSKGFRFVSFIGTFLFANVAAYSTVVFLGDLGFLKLYDNWNYIRNLWVIDFGALKLVLPSIVFTFVLSLWGIFFRTDDKKKEFSDNYQQRNDTRFTVAQELFLRQGDNAAGARAAGLIELISIRNNLNTEEYKHRIDRYTSNTDLSNLNLFHADLSNANLSNAKLNNANLRQTNLSNANLFYAKLRGAKLHSANFTDADLRKADLSGTDLTQVNLTALIKATLVSAIYDESTKFPTGFKPERAGMVKKDK